MTDVAFHFNAADKVDYACRLLRKAYGKGSALLVLAEPALARQLEASLWTMAPGAFIPHCLLGAPPYVLERTPIHIGSALPADPRARMLVNLQPQWVDGWNGFEKVFEIVALDPQDRQAARERLRRYRAAGADPVWHEVRSA